MTRLKRRGKPRSPGSPPFTGNRGGRHRASIIFLGRWFLRGAVLGVKAIEIIDLSRHFFFGKEEVKGGGASRFRFESNEAIVIFDDRFTDAQAEA